MKKTVKVTQEGNVTMLTETRTREVVISGVPLRREVSDEIKIAGAVGLQVHTLLTGDDNLRGQAFTFEIVNEIEALKDGDFVLAHASLPNANGETERCVAVARIYSRESDTGLIRLRACDGSVEDVVGTEYTGDSFDDEDSFGITVFAKLCDARAIREMTIKHMSVERYSFQEAA